MLGTVIAPHGTGRAGKPCFRYRLQGTDFHAEGEIRVGELLTLDLPGDVAVQAELEPARGFDLGSGSGKPVSGTVQGGTVGLILDGRGRPLWPPSK
jgi:hypothetical protein